MVRVILGRLAPVTAITVEATQGTLWSGIAARGVLSRGVHRLPPGASLFIEHVSLPPLRQWRSGAVRVHGLEARLPNAVITVRACEGTPALLACDDVAADGALGTLPDARVLIQRLEIAAPLSTHEVRWIHNGRAYLRYSDPITCYGRLQPDWDFQCYARRLDAAETAPLLPLRRPIRRVEGVVRDALVHLSGPFREPMVTGGFYVQELRRLERSLQDSPGTLRLRVLRPRGRAGRPDAYGEIVLQRGRIAVERTAVTINLLPSTLLLPGGGLPMALRLEGAATIDERTIQISVLGTREAPVLRLSSVPPLPQQWLLLMLATGNSWRGGGGAFNEGQISSEMAQDFLDYLLFGGRGTRLARRFGISDFAVIYDPATREVGVEALWFNRIGAKYTVEPPQAPAGPLPQEPPSLTHKLGAELRLDGSRSVEVEGERETLQRPAAAAPEQPQGQGPLNVLDKLFLKYRRRF